MFGTCARPLEVGMLEHQRAFPARRSLADTKDQGMGRTDHLALLLLPASLASSPAAPGSDHDGEAGRRAGPVEPVDPTHDGLALSNI